MVKNYLEVLFDNERIEAKRIVLRKFEKRDKEDIFEYASDDETLEYLVWEGAKTVEEAEECIYNFYWSKPGIYAIEVKDKNKCIGCIDLRMEPEHEKASFGYVLNRHYWNKGYMTEALSELLRLSFEKLLLNRVESTHYIGNPGSGRVMEKCGMRLEGIAEGELKIKGIFRDVAHYGILRKDWIENNR